MTVTTTDREGARVITWDRQARRNAWDLDTMTAIADAIEAAGADAAVRCVVLRGAGEHFSAGDDLQSAIEADSAAWAATIEGFQRMTRVVLACPVLAAARLYRPWRERPPAFVRAFRYAPWLVANLHLDRLPARGSGAPPAWDNVIHDSRSL